MNWFRRNRTNRPRPGPTRARQARPGVEALDDRILLAGNVTSVPVFNSNPGAAATLYLDFNADTESTWGAYGVRTAVGAGVLGYLAGGPLGVPLGIGAGVLSSVILPSPTTPAFDLDGDPTTFSPHEQDVIKEICQRVAEAYSPFDINVTTVDPGSYPHGKAAKTCIGGTGSWLRGADSTTLGISLVGSFHNALLENVGFVFAVNFGDNPAGIAKSAAHEAGHIFGLDHRAAVADPTQFPIMEQGLVTDLENPLVADDPRLQWQNTANLDGHAQDDMAIIASADNGFGFRPQDHGQDAAHADPMTWDGTKWTGSGVVEQSTDRDCFSFTATGPVTVRVNTIGEGAMLKASAELRDAAGNLLPATLTRDGLNVTLTYAPGADATTGAYFTRSYTLVVEGAGGYGDVGQYTVSAQETGGPMVVGSVPSRASIRVTFDKPIDPTTLGPNVTVTDRAGHTTTVLSITPVAGTGNKAFDIAFVPFAGGGYRLNVGAGVQDMAGNKMNQDRDAVNGQPGVDEYHWEDFTGPQVTRTDPSAGHIRVTFNEAIDPTTFTAANVTLLSPSGSPVHVVSVTPLAGSTNAFYINLASFPVGGYDLTIDPRVQDLAGNPMNQDGNAVNGEVPQDQYFVSVRDTTAPTVTGIISSSTGYGLTLGFSKSIDPATITAGSYRVVNHATGAVVAVTGVAPVPNSDSAWWYVYFQAPVGTYDLTVQPTVSDIFGNRLQSAYMQTFFLSNPTPLTSQLPPNLNRPIPLTGPPTLATGPGIDPVINPVAGGPTTINPAVNSGTALAAKASGLLGTDPLRTNDALIPPNGRMPPPV